MNVLFVGGSKDGEKMDVPESQAHVRVVVDPGPVAYSESANSRAAVGYDVETYERMRLRGSSETFQVFVPMGWTGDQLMRYLLRSAEKR